jgi:hypothetical protein
MLDPQIVYHERTVFDLFDVLRDVGGVLQCLKILFSILLYSHSKSSFIYDLFGEIYGQKPTFFEKSWKSKQLKEDLRELQENLLESLDILNFFRANDAKKKQDLESTLKNTQLETEAQ